MAIAYINRGKEQRVHNGHPWIFRSDIERVKGTVAPGDVISVSDFKGRFLGKAMYNPQSQIALRFLSRLDEDINDAFIYRRIKRAIDYRRSFADLRSCRLVFAESDELPALIVDSFGDYLVLQSLALGMERFKGCVVEALKDILHPIGIYERNDVPVRTLEGMEQMKGLLSGSVPERVEILENGVRFFVDVIGGQKTGFFLDQKENRAAIKPFVKDAMVLDCFTHTGSFALHAAHFGARNVIGVDISEHACAFATENAQLNHFSDTVTFKQANVFDLLNEESRKRVRYDMVILDPPAFSKSRSTVDGAMRGYKEINLRAMQLLREGGFLVTCSCSQHITPDLFQQVIREAAYDARVRLREVEMRSQAKDHPILFAAPETNYLKCGIFQKL